MQPIEFNAPWGRSLKITSIASTAILLALGVVGLLHPDFGLFWQLLMIGLPACILLIALLSMVRGYSLSDSKIEIRRLGWTTGLPLLTLQAVEGKADAMLATTRLLANGGLFSFTGFYWNRQLKLFRAYATDPSRAVILRYPRRKIVITPHDPQQFIMRARTYLKTASFPR